MNLTCDVILYDQRGTGLAEPSLESFLDAIASRLSVFPQSYVNNGQPVPTPDWRFMADVLRVGRIYE